MLPSSFCSSDSISCCVLGLTQRIPPPENPIPIRANERMSRYSVDHHSFTVSDMEQSLEFYRDLLGLEVIKMW